mgnify:CR=1 FL=1
MLSNIFNEIADSAVPEVEEVAEGLVEIGASVIGPAAIVGIVYIGINTILEGFRKPH